jgi:hypothetical protein
LSVYALRKNHHAGAARKNDAALQPGGVTPIEGIEPWTASNRYTMAKNEHLYRSRA